jgi:cell division transport system permease protein
MCNCLHKFISHHSLLITHHFNIMAHIWHETFSNIKHSGFIGFLSIIIVALTIMVLCLLLIITNQINAQFGILKKSPFVTAFLADGLSDSEIKNIKKEIEILQQVSSVKYVSKDEALRRTGEMFGERRDVLEGLKDMNPLPGSLEIEIRNEYLAKVKEVAEIVKKIPGIDEVQHAGNTSKFIKSAELITILIFSIMGLASVIIIFFSITITIYIRRDEIKIMRLMGSTSGYIRIPLLLQGLFEGFIGSVLGLAILYGLFTIYGMYNLALMDINIESFLTLEQIGVVIGLGAFLGFLGGALPHRRFIRM